MGYPAGMPHLGAGGEEAMTERAALDAAFRRMMTGRAEKLVPFGFARRGSVLRTLRAGRNLPTLHSKVFC